MIDVREVERIKSELITPQAIRAQLERLGWTQADLARFLRVDPRSARRWVQEPGTIGHAPMPFASFALLRLVRKS